MTHTIPNDYSRCSNMECPLRDGCLRALDSGDPLRQSYHFFEFGYVKEYSGDEMVRVPVCHNDIWIDPPFDAQIES